MEESALPEREAMGIFFFVHAGGVAYQGVTVTPVCPTTPGLDEKIFAVPGLKPVSRPLASMLATNGAGG
jgi:hypothetical protein